jgi:hypothetical protein
MCQDQEEEKTQSKKGRRQAEEQAMTRFSEFGPCRRRVTNHGGVRLTVILAAMLTLGVMFTCASGAWAATGTFGPEAFGVYSFENSFENKDHSSATQAGSHLYALTTTVFFNHTLAGEEENEYCREIKRTEETECVGTKEFSNSGLRTYGDLKDIEVNLPAGFVVNPSATGVKCTEAQLETRMAAGGGCPQGSAVGVATGYLEFLGETKAAIYSMVPPAGVPAEFGFNVGEIGIIGHVMGKVRTGSDYGASGATLDLPQTLPIYGVKTTFWGDPADKSHDAERGRCALAGAVRKSVEQLIIEEERELKGKSSQEQGQTISCPVEEGKSAKPLLTLPSSCSGATLVTTLSVDSWQHPETKLDPQTSPNTSTFSAAVTGCNKLRFDASLNVRPEPEAAAADSPSGLNVELNIPQEENVNGLAESNLKEAVVRLPAGMTVSPSAANGLGACSLEQIGLTNANPASCPDASKLGTVEIETQLLEHPLRGSVFLAQQGNLAGNGSNPFGSLFSLYVVAEGQGVVVKLPGVIELGEDGQLTARFGKDPLTNQYLPQLPFEDLKMSFFGGSKASLMTPSACGTYTTTSQLFPWSGQPPAEPSSSFTVSQGCATGGFNPSFTAGTNDNQAGEFSPFSLTLSRQDGERRLGGVQVTMPPGLLAIIKNVPQCPEPQASMGQCSSASEIGETTTAVGPGASPYWVKGGKVYLTGPYGGAPFGLSIVVPAVAGPFNLGTNGAPVIVRARIAVDAHTAQAIVTSDPLPKILQGVPLDIRTVNVTINRHEFMFNPTNCSSLIVAGTVSSADGAIAPESSPFHAVNCANLPFKPSFKASTQAKTSKASGANLTVKVGSGKGQANIAKVRVILPKQLPARLTTLQKACTEAQFNANPALCPAASVVGTATAVTPVLAHPLTGPAYLVSHGGAAFPDLVFVLQGEGVLLYLDGNTNIKKGITSSTFNSVPDAPISTFETVFPEGPHSVLATNIPAKAKGSMCKQKLTMPTTITGQNGAVSTRTIKIAITGCPKKSKSKKVGGKKK